MPITARGGPAQSREPGSQAELPTLAGTVPGMPQLGAGRKRTGWDLNQALIWDVGVPAGILTAVPNACCKARSFKNTL